MSGGDHDGDEAIIIAYEPLVQAFKPMVKASLPLPADLEGSFQSDTVEHILQRGCDEKQLMDEALSKTCRQAVHDSATVGTLNGLWLAHADRDVSRSTRP